MRSYRIIVVLAALAFAGACGMSGGNSNGTAKANNSNAAAAEPPAIEITSEALAKEYLADAAATDTKYKGKEVAVTGRLWLAQKIGEEYFVSLDGVDSTATVKGARISCSAGKSRDAELLVAARETNERTAKEIPGFKMPPLPTITIKGTYLSSTPPDTPMGTIDIKPCKILPPK